MGTAELHPIWDNILNHFGERRVYSPKFALWYQLAFDRTKERYKQLTRIEPGISQFDWLVTDYRERQRLLTDTGTIGDIGKTTGSYNGTSTTRNTGTQKTDGSGTVDTDTSENGYNRNDSYNDTVNLTKQNPNSISYETGISGQAVTSANVSSTTNPTTPNLNWTTPSTQAEGFAKQSDHQNTQNNGTVDTTTTDTSTRTDNLQSDTTTGSTTLGSTDSTRTLDTQTKEQEQFTGRGGSVQELLTQAREYIKNSSSWLWLRKELDVIFIGVFDTDDYPLYEEVE